MLKDLGLKSIDDLFQDVPEDVKLQRLLNVPEGKSVDDGTIRVILLPSFTANPVAVDLGRRIRKAVSVAARNHKIQVICKGHLLNELVNRLLEQSI